MFQWIGLLTLINFMYMCSAKGADNYISQSLSKLLTIAI